MRYIIYLLIIFLCAGMVEKAYADVSDVSGDLNVVLYSYHKYEQGHNGEEISNFTPGVWGRLFPFKGSGLHLNAGAFLNIAEFGR